MTEHGFAKINLCMDVLGRREDGYHDVRTVMQSVAFGDSVTIKRGSGRGVKFLSDIEYLPSDDRNNAVRAAKLFLNLTNHTDDAELLRFNISCVKRIPVCGGLGGSSADAAAVLKLLNRRYGEVFTLEELSEISATLGADVPFCVVGGAALAEGIGSELSLLPPLPRCGIVIIKPEFSGITSDLFAAIDNGKIRAHPDTDGLVAALIEGDLQGVARRVFNVFESVLTAPQARLVNDAKGRLLDLGALGSSMSGSGSAVFGLFGDLRTAKSAYLNLREENIECYLTIPRNRG
ncbi:MAG: 4-(cytidine 5'-diphospho)-2-C-methyl-D-erythritol kinase [Oscillospiraceae bacterium]|jgi:4-diphosphocytidyl-2-C-methyl-D-erythritol kinase|nr:4-(cytidine 5'-diphospho)-2-C-methyl-D-erythritol kinase [Oscillospiraceae bacterium]